uniref:Uncharacterized protein n=1 Tax=Rangifer tarandus platyrhynchus TaxID=3082113 RepID=A0ACB0F977_RANTA|nr:unnamed protein product [Rangifer tarandus platyrhynchus]
MENRTRSLGFRTRLSAPGVNNTERVCGNRSLEDRPETHLNPSWSRCRRCVRGARAPVCWDTGALPSEVCGPAGPLPGVPDPAPHPAPPRGPSSRREERKAAEAESLSLLSAANKAKETRRTEAERQPQPARAHRGAASRRPASGLFIRSRRARPLPPSGRSRRAPIRHCGPANGALRCPPTPRLFSNSRAASRSCRVTARRVSAGALGPAGAFPRAAHPGLRAVRRDGGESTQALILESQPCSGPLESLHLTPVAPRHPTPVARVFSLRDRSSHPGAESVATPR